MIFVLNNGVFTPVVIALFLLVTLFGLEEGVSRDKVAAPQAGQLNLLAGRDRA